MKGKWLVVLILLTLAAPAAVKAQFSYTIYNGSVTITGYSGVGGSVSIPAVINSLPVTGIGQYVFEFSSVTSVTIPSSVTLRARTVFDGDRSVLNEGMDISP